MFNKPAGIIGHGGGTEHIVQYYKEPVLDSIWNALSYPVEMDIIKMNDNKDNGIVLPVKNVRKIENSIFPVQEYDWDDIEERLNPLVDRVLAKIKMMHYE